MALDEANIKRAETTCLFCRQEKFVRTAKHSRVGAAKVSPVCDECAVANGLKWVDGRWES